MLLCTRLVTTPRPVFHIVTATERTFKPVQTICGRRTDWPFCIEWRSDIPTCKTCLRALRFDPRTRVVA